MKLLIILIIFLSSQNVFSQTEKFDEIVFNVVNNIYNIKFDQAQEEVYKLIQKYPKHPAGKFFDAMIVWWKIMMDIDDEKYDEIFINKLEDVIDFCEDILDENPNDADALFFQGGALGFRGRLYAIREEWFSAAGDGKDALPLVKKAYKADPSKVDVQLGFGIFNYYAAVIPEKYSFVKPFMLFIPKGDKEKGIEQLNHVAYNGKFAKYESRYFLMTIYYSLENDLNKAEKYCDMLLADFPDNPVFHRYKGRIFVKRNDYENASKVFKNILNKYTQQFHGYNENIKRESLYYLGINEKNNYNIDEAIKYFLESESISKKIDSKKESGFRIMSVLNLGNLYDLKSDRNKAKYFYNQVLQFRDFRDSHSLAEMYLKKPYGK